jgi:hypothetical protein
MWKTPRTIPFQTFEEEVTVDEKTCLAAMETRSFPEWRIYEFHTKRPLGGPQPPPRLHFIYVPNRDCIPESLNFWPNLEPQKRLEQRMLALRWLPILWWNQLVDGGVYV